MNKLKELRKERNLTQKELSVETGIPYRTIQRWENGETTIKQDKAQELAEHFGVSVGYLLGYEDKVKKEFYKQLDLYNLDEFRKFRIKLNIELSLLNGILDNDYEKISDKVSYLNNFADKELKRGMENECLEPQELQELFELRNVASYFTSLVETLEQLQYNLKKLLEDTGKDT
ncbi:helix-turn-helix domain-containing protein [Streptococcus suis]|uniref:XRE family transcriptional regulator n=1 Tax=Streptococcus suis TaxID=1307 RepID=A0A3R8LYF3_STRSU|nr:helix-turn-helix transcriptional regulator [Streptococcus suis]MCO0797770.1 helix-turn-helix domain-containing protein [Streptococcus suis]MCO0809543.1 helix-turn-helix domain-containing protein [Streptococcus suis]MCO0844444.1 helix-turn-helix domain-containing protein [Streptococcus suis]RRN48833.1 XRE family transcriptional regulator [Streptococcus suis]HEL1591348.1 helix-turn-helix transcriptional regulator [Streptococcus suis]